MSLPWPSPPCNDLSELIFLRHKGKKSHTHQSIQKLHCNLPVNEEKSPAMVCLSLIDINSLPPPIMAIIKLHPDAKQGF